MSGVQQHQIDANSLLRLEKVWILNPLATTTNFYVASVDPSGLTVGNALTLTAAGGVLTSCGRKPTLVLTDASGGGGGLSVTATFFGQLRGNPVSASVTTTCTSGSATTSTSTQVFDQITSIVVTAITGAGAGDALTCGISGDGLGLPFTIDKVTDVVGFFKFVSGVQAAPIAISSNTVDVTNGAVNHGGTITAANDIFLVVVKRGVATDGMGNNGVFA